MKGNINVLGQVIHLKNHTPMLVAPLLKGVSSIDSGVFYAPYIPMITKSKYKFSRAKWYVAEFDWRRYDEVRQWCAEQFGLHPKNPDAWCRWWHKYESKTFLSKIFFRDEEDYILFILRWA